MTITKITNDNAMSIISSLSCTVPEELLEELKNRICLHDIKSSFFKILLVGRYGSEFYNKLLNEIMQKKLLDLL